MTDYRDQNGNDNEDPRYRYTLFVGEGELYDVRAVRPNTKSPDLTHLAVRVKQTPESAGLGVHIGQGVRVTIEYEPPEPPPEKPEKSRAQMRLEEAIAEAEEMSREGERVLARIFPGGLAE